jgi:hypothetical protein
MHKPNLYDAPAEIVRVVDERERIGLVALRVWDIRRIRRDGDPGRREEVVLIELDVVPKIPVVIPHDVENQGRVWDRLVLPEIELI